MKRLRLPITGLILSIILYITTIILDLDLFERTIQFLESLENFEIDEIILPVLVFIIFITFYLFKQNKSNSVRKEKIEIYKAMMSSSHHIINNFLNQIQLLKLTAEELPDFDPEVLKLYEQTVNDTKKQLSDLNNIKEIDAKTIIESVFPKEMD